MAGDKAFCLDLCHCSTRQALVDPEARLPPSSSVIPQKPAVGLSPVPRAEGPGVALLLAWVLLPVSCGGPLEVTAGCLREQDQGTHWSPRLPEAVTHLAWGRAAHLHRE